MVIYWLGYVDSLEAAAPREIVLAADLPSTWALPGDSQPRTISPEHTTAVLRARVDAAPAEPSCESVGASDLGVYDGCGPSPDNSQSNPLEECL